MGYAPGDIYTWGARYYRLVAHNSLGPETLSNWTATLLTANHARPAARLVNVPAGVDAVFVGSSDAEWDAINGRLWRERGEAIERWAAPQIEALKDQLAHAGRVIAQHDRMTHNLRVGVAKLRKLREFKREFNKLAKRYLATPTYAKAKKKPTKAQRKAKKKGGG